jgi:DNA topoisomerase II
MELADKYRKHTHREHILNLPDTYIGSIETATETVWLHDAEGNFTAQTIAVNPGFYKLVDELLVNAHDHVVRLRTKKSANPVKHISVSYTDGVLEVENDGESIDVAKHPEHNMYIPQLIFGELLTSTNYDKDEKKLVGGKNGYGVKLVNIFAKQLQVRIVDPIRSLSYDQTFHDNMTRADAPKVKASKGKASVTLRWFPDYARFGYADRLPEGMVRLIERRVYDLAMTVGKEVKVSWNGTLLKCRSLTDYAKSFGCQTLVHEAPNDRWEIVVAATPGDGFFHSSFVNGIWTSKGGTHVDAVTNQVVGHITDYLETKKKCKTKNSTVKEHLGVFLVSLIENPSFSSQTKETLTTKASAFGSSPKLSEDTLKKIVSKLGIVEAILEVQAAKDAKDNSKTDGQEAEPHHGHSQAGRCGDGGHQGLGQVHADPDRGRFRQGDGALGSLAGAAQVLRRLPAQGQGPEREGHGGFQGGAHEGDCGAEEDPRAPVGQAVHQSAELRYGSMMIMTDQDYDGSHIRGLLINLFHELWHELIAIPGFLTYMATPIVKATKGKETKNFYSQFDYEEWRKAEGAKGWTVKYYKGLGTSTRDEAKDYFAKPQAVAFDFSEGSDEAIDLAFNKKRADDRKTWLQGYDKTVQIPAGLKLPYRTSSTRTSSTSPTTTWSVRFPV